MNHLMWESWRTENLSLSPHRNTDKTSLWGKTIFIWARKPVWEFQNPCKKVHISNEHKTKKKNNFSLPVWSSAILAHLIPERDPFTPKFLPGKWEWVKGASDICSILGSYRRELLSPSRHWGGQHQYSTSTIRIIVPKKKVMGEGLLAVCTA